jgi:aerobic-type carbon monoxide dehydrogenase small subunit (CoxS/CutS family)
MEINFTLNHKSISVDVSPATTLLELLRDHLKLTGTKQGCEIGECGACSVIIDGELYDSCLVLAPKVEGHDVVTIEGIRKPDGSPDDLQQNFIKFGAVQCGYCIPGMVLAGEVLLSKTQQPSRIQIREALTGNLCRCTGYQQIVDAIEYTAKERRQAN